MKKGKRTEEQIIGVLKQMEAGRTVKEVAPELGVSEATIYTWKSKYGCMEVNEARRLKELENENRRLKHMVANQPKPCCKLPAFGEGGAVTNRCHHRRRGERPNTGHSPKAFARSILVRDSTDFTVELLDTGFDLTPLTDKHPVQPEEG